MEGSSNQADEASPGSVYRLPQQPYRSEDILFCVDVDVEAKVEMRVMGPKGQPVTRLDSIKQAILLFVSNKLSINPDHRFSFATLEQSVNWGRREFSNHVARAVQAVQALKAADSPYGVADLTQLFSVASQEAKKSKERDRIFRVILIYCRSKLKVQHQWPISQKSFTFDVIYLHDKPSTENCPQKVYDSLVDVLEHVTENEGYIFESGTGLTRVLIRHLCTLLAHPEQRCVQDDLDVPKPLSRKLPSSQSETTTVEELA